MRVILLGLGVERLPCFTYVLILPVLSLIWQAERMVIEGAKYWDPNKDPKVEASAQALSPPLQFHTRTHTHT